LPALTKGKVGERWIRKKRREKQGEKKKDREKQRAWHGPLLLMADKERKG